MNCTACIALGGGSAIDCGKAISILIANGGEPLDYLEVIGKGKKFSKPSVPFIAIPTTSGTGSEVTKNAVLDVTEHNVKVSMRSEFMLPKLTIIDPQLMVSAPPEVTASSGLDALTQVIEPYISNKANPITDALCIAAIQKARNSLVLACQDGSNIAAREDMAFVALCGGLALANSKLGAVHGIAGVLGGLLHASHGVLCASLLPYTLEVTLKVLRENEGNTKINSKKISYPI